MDTKSHPTLATPWTVALQALLSMGFPRQEYSSGLPFPSPRDLLDPEIEPVSLALTCVFFMTESPGLLLLLLLLLSHFSRVHLCATPWTAAYQAPPSMVFSRQEYWSGVPSPSLCVMPSEHI